MCLYVAGAEGGIQATSTPTKHPSKQISLELCHWISDIRMHSSSMHTVCISHRQESILTCTQNLGRVSQHALCRSMSGQGVSAWVGGGGGLSVAQCMLQYMSLLSTHLLTDRCQNITFVQLPLQTVKISLSVILTTTVHDILYNSPT